MRIVCLNENIGTEFWNNTLERDQIKMEPELLNMSHSTATGHTWKYPQGPRTSQEERKSALGARQP